MGVETDQWNVRVPFAFSWVDVSFPFDAQTSGFGTVKCIVTWSGSSLGWSLQGHQRSAPAVWQVTPIQGWPSGVLDQMNPSDHGGLAATRGLPSYATRTRTVSPGWRV